MDKYPYDTYSAKNTDKHPDTKSFVEKYIYSERGTPIVDGTKMPVSGPGKRDRESQTIDYGYISRKEAKLLDLLRMPADDVEDPPVGVPKTHVPKKGGKTYPKETLKKLTPKQKATLKAKTDGKVDKTKHGIDSFVAPPSSAQTAAKNASVASKPAASGSSFNSSAKSGATQGSMTGKVEKPSASGSSNEKNRESAVASMNKQAVSQPGARTPSDSQLSRNDVPAAKPASGLRSPSDSQLSDPHNVTPGVTSSPQMRQTIGRSMEPKPSTVPAGQRVTEVFGPTYDLDPTLAGRVAKPAAPAPGTRVTDVFGPDVALDPSITGRLSPAAKPDGMVTDVFGPDYRQDPSIAGRLAPKAPPTIARINPDGSLSLVKDQARLPGMETPARPADSVYAGDTAASTLAGLNVNTSFDSPLADLPGSYDSSQLASAVTGDRAPAYTAANNLENTRAAMSDPTAGTIAPAASGKMGTTPAPKAITDRVPAITSTARPSTASPQSVAAARAAITGTGSGGIAPMPSASASLRAAPTAATVSKPRALGVDKYAGPVTKVNPAGGEEVEDLTQDAYNRANAIPGITPSKPRALGVDKYAGTQPDSALSPLATVKASGTAGVSASAGAGATASLPAEYSGSDLSGLYEGVANDNPAPSNPADQYPDINMDGFAGTPSTSQPVGPPAAGPPTDGGNNNGIGTETPVPGEPPPVEPPPPVEEQYDPYAGIMPWDHVAYDAIKKAYEASGRTYTPAQFITAFYNQPDLNAAFQKDPKTAARYAGKSTVSVPLVDQQQAA